MLKLRRAPAGVLVLLMCTALQAGQSSEPESILFDTPPAVETAALYTQTLKEAPADVTVITRQQIRAYGYRTLAEALSNVRGFFTSSDTAVQFLGVRGFNLPGDYNTRVLVMLNGHYLTDSVFGAMYLFGQDFGLDMDLVQRIEVVRGPSSALYGSNGMLATINIFTTAPADSSKATSSVDFGSFGSRRTNAAGAWYLGRGANLLLSGSAFDTAGRTVNLPGYGSADRVDAEYGYRSFAQLTWNNWSVTANFHDHQSIVPVGWYGATYGDGSTGSRDSHSFVEAAYARPLNDRTELRWRSSYDQFRYYGRYHYNYEPDVITDTRDFAEGDWLSSRVSIVRQLGRAGNVIIGSGFDHDLRTLQVTEDLQPSYTRYRELSVPAQFWSVFSQYEKTLSSRWSIFAGLRWDDTTRDRAFLSPKLALIWKQNAATSYKFIYGRAFRNASAYERYWQPNPVLNAERTNTFEIVREQKLGSSIDLITSAFRYNIHGLIEGVEVSDLTVEYRNVADATASGLEAELKGTVARHLEFGTSATFHAVQNDSSRKSVPNSPRLLLMARASAPLFRNRLTLSSALRHIDARKTVYGATLPAYMLADLTATTNKLHRQFDLQFGLRNLTNRLYADPLSTEHLTATVPRAGRQFFVRLMWRYGE